MKYKIMIDWECLSMGYALHTVEAENEEQAKLIAQRLPIDLKYSLRDEWTKKVSSVISEEEWNARN